jgi:restriction system protein
MTLPDFQAVMLPYLQFLAEGQVLRHAEVLGRMVDHFQMTAQERAQLLPSGRQAVIDNRVGWARTYLKKAGLLATPSRGAAAITDEGRKLLAERPARISVSLLKSRYPAFVDFHQAASDETAGAATSAQESGATLAAIKTPQERLEESYMELRSELAENLLERVLEVQPAFFEQLVIDLLLGMGYGGTAADAGQSIGRSGDDGIDGIIKEDKLGLDVIYVQAKRWQSSVGRPLVQAFAGSLEGHRARKGVLITTSAFTQDAREYVTRIEKKIVLIDGPMLAQLMIDHNIGVAPQKTLIVKRIDTDYFETT